MRKFNRGKQPFSEQEIKKYHNQWDGKFLKSQVHAGISNVLYERQEHFCAYCERYIGEESGGHTEHLERRKDNPSRTFDWTNMFFSCNNGETCGKYKDNPKNRIVFDIQDVIDPSKEDPAEFFEYNLHDGSILPKSDDKATARRAGETIRIFNLNDEKLKQIRKNMIINFSACLECGCTMQEIRNILSTGKKTHCPSVYEFLMEK